MKTKCRVALITSRACMKAMDHMTKTFNNNKLTLNCITKKKQNLVRETDL